MERNYFKLIGPILFLGVSIGFTYCSSEDPEVQDGYIQSKMIEIENSVLLKKYNTTPASYVIFNESYFNKVKELKYATSDFERNKIKSELCRYDLSTSKFSGQQKHDSPSLTEEEIIIYDSFLSSFNKSKENPVAICELYINEVLCLKINNQVKRDFVERITFLKDLLIFVDYGAHKEKVSSDVVEKVLKNPFDDCFDNCMSSEIMHAMSSTVRKIIFLLRQPLSIAEILVICVSDCV
jgi:hypothetical protein